MLRRIKQKLEAAIDNLVQQGANVIFLQVLDLWMLEEARQRDYPEVMFLN